MTGIGREPVRAAPGAAFRWYAEALRLFRAAPMRFAGLTAVIVAAELLLGLVPVAGRPAAAIVVPILACSLLFASLATDRGDKPRALHLVAPFAAPVAALVAIVLASVAVFAVEWIVAWQADGIDLLDVRGEAMRGSTIALVYALGVLVSLPLTLVPLHALFENATVGQAFASSIAAFTRNLPAFLAYGVLSYLLLGIAVATMGLGLLVALPLWAASAYAAWKELFAHT